MFHSELTGDVKVAFETWFDEYYGNVEIAVGKWEDFLNANGVGLTAVTDDPCALAVFSYATNLWLFPDYDLSTDAWRSVTPSTVSQALFFYNAVEGLYNSSLQNDVCNPEKWKQIAQNSENAAHCSTALTFLLALAIQNIESLLLDEAALDCPQKAVLAILKAPPGWLSINTTDPNELMQALSQSIATMRDVVNALYVARGTIHRMSPILQSTARVSRKAYMLRGLPEGRFSPQEHEHFYLKEGEIATDANWLVEGDNRYAASDFAPRLHSHPYLPVRLEEANALLRYGEIITAEDLALKSHTHHEYADIHIGPVMAMYFLQGNGPVYLAAVKHFHLPPIDSKYWIWESAEYGEYVLHIPADATAFVARRLNHARASKWSKRIHSHPQYISRPEGDALAQTTPPNFAYGFVDERRGKKLRARFETITFTGSVDLPYPHVDSVFCSLAASNARQGYVYAEYFYRQNVRYARLYATSSTPVTVNCIIFQEAI